MKKIIWILIILVVLVISGGVSYYFIFRNDSEENLITELETNHLPDSLADSLQNSTIILDTVIIVDEPEIKDSINIQAIIDSLNNQLMIQEKRLLKLLKNKNIDLQVICCKSWGINITL